MFNIFFLIDSLFLGNKLLFFNEYNSLSFFNKTLDFNLLLFLFLIWLLGLLLIKEVGFEFKGVLLILLLLNEFFLFAINKLFTEFIDFEFNILLSLFLELIFLLFLKFITDFLIFIFSGKIVSLEWEFFVFSLQFLLPQKLLLRALMNQQNELNRLYQQYI